MAKWIHNISAEEKIYQGRPISPGSFFLIPENLEIEYKNDQDLVLDLLNGTVKMSTNGSQSLSGTNINQVDFLKDFITQTVFSSTYAFSQKTTSDGKKLFRRKHGTKKTIPANTTDTLEIVVPYTYAKINKAEIINCSSGDTADLKVYDNSVGTLSGVPNYMLNQFGFGVVMPDGMYIDESNYDADLIQGMKIELSYTNNTENAKEVGLNITLHQLV